MDVWSSLLIIIFQLLNLAKAEWNPNSAIILVGSPHPIPKMFPLEVRIHQRLNCVVYFSSQGEHLEKVYPYCPLVNGIEECNYEMEPVAIYNYVRGARPPLVDECDFPVRFSLEKTKDSYGNDHCQHYTKRGTRYRFIYLLCDVDLPAQERVSIFEMCYQDDPKKMQIIIGSFEILKPNLLRNFLLSEERDYQFDYYGPPDHNNTHGYFYHLYEQNREYLPRAVVPPELLPFANQRRVAHHFTNTAPMLSVLKPGWDLFMRNLRDEVSRLGYTIEVVAGLLNVLFDDHRQEMHLGLSENGDPMVKIPGIFWLMIRSTSLTRGVVIMMHNELYQENGGRPNLNVFDARRCGVDKCYTSFNLGVAMLNRVEYPHHFIYCCNAYVITTRFNLDEGDRTTILRFP